MIANKNKLSDINARAGPQGEINAQTNKQIDRQTVKNLDKAAGRDIPQPLWRLAE